MAIGDVLQFDEDQLEKSEKMRSACGELIRNYDAEGRHHLACQVARAFAEVPDSSLGRLYDLLMQVR